ncbi:MAG: SUMF1/EgtB/PvdO family nonheme iron enzyme [Proteobacteria bacterium]|nr:SUMF1/EgtB/PvdO family nonheme iron enzyme [Pseudomonadota bacterium]
MASAQVRAAGKDLLSLALMDARNHTLRWIGAYEQAYGPALKVPPAPERNPPLWELGHVGWYQERWIARNVQRDRGERCNPAQTRLASLLPDADRWFDATAGRARRGGRWSLDLPDLQTIKQYLVDTLETTLDLLDGTHGDDDARLYFYRLALFEEDRRAEAFAAGAQMLGLDAGLLTLPATHAPREPLFFPATRWMLGQSGGGFVFDNEQAAHEVRVPEFEIDAQPVSWAQYCEFVEDGGYDEPRFWADAGWAWAKREGRRTPRYVDQMRQGVLQRRFGRLARVPTAQPAVHVCWYEADAWCRWAGRRLPTEVEWEAAAHQGASRGLRWGDVWEWTASTFRPYPGFVAGPDRDHSVPAFGQTKVLRGASFATRARLRSAKYRHFAIPEADAQFCGFRSCAI